MAKTLKRNAPSFVVPMAAVTVEELPEGPEWLYELKLDGYRALLLKDGSRIELRSRNDKPLKYPRVSKAAEALTADQLVLDGEVVAIGRDGKPSFQALQHRGEHPDHEILFYVFDVLHVDGSDLTGLPLIERRKRLPALLGKASTIRLSQELPGTAAAILKAVHAAGLEGVIAKRKNSPYQPGERPLDWQKLKLELQQEFVVGGYRTDGAKRVDALLVGYYRNKQLVFAGKVRAGMVPHVRGELLKQLEPSYVVECPFVNLPDLEPGRWGGGVTAEQMQEMTWVRPAVVVQVRFQEWTTEGRLRLAKYLGLRPDKEPRSVRREG